MLIAKWVKDSGNGIGIGKGVACDLPRFLVPVVLGFAFLGSFGVQLIRKVYDGKLYFR